jgi:hypothetical protein
MTRMSGSVSVLQVLLVLQVLKVGAEMLLVLEVRPHPKNQWSVNPSHSPAGPSGL